MFNVDEAIANAVKTRNIGALTAFRALRQRMLVAMARPGNRRGHPLSQKQIYQLMRAEIRERKESNEFSPPSSEVHQINREVVAVLGRELTRATRSSRVG